MTLFIAHRGDPIQYRENTLPAFISGERLGADMIELDVQLSRDGKCVIVHDDTLTRLWNVDAAVSDLTYDQIRSLTANDACDIPLLSDVLTAVSLPVMIDVKYTESIDSIVHTLLDMQAVDRALIVGGNVDAHRRVRHLLPNVSIGLTWDNPEAPSQSLLDELDVEYFNPPWWLLMPELGDGTKTLGPDIVDDMHERGLKVSVWTVDDVSYMHPLVDIGVDAIISNRSGELLTAYSRGRK